MKDNDPQLKYNDEYRYRKPYSEAELIDRMWTKGSYNFRFEIYRSTDDRPQVVHIPLKPQDIWNFNTQEWYRHKTWFRKAKWTYRVDVNNFTAKRVELASHQISLGKWDLSKESLERKISIYEEDLGEEKEEVYSFETSKLRENNFNGNLKLNFDVGILNAEVGGSAGTKTVYTEKITHQIKVKTIAESDVLALLLPIYFYDPIIRSQSGQSYEVNTYGSGSVKFGIYVK